MLPASGPWNCCEVDDITHVDAEVAVGAWSHLAATAGELRVTADLSSLAQPAAMAPTSKTASRGIVRANETTAAI